MTTPAEAVNKLTRVLEASIERAVYELAPADDPPAAIRWTVDRYATHLEVHLRSGRIIKGDGEAKLEAIVDAERRLAGDDEALA